MVHKLEHGCPRKSVTLNRTLMSCEGFIGINLVILDKCWQVTLRQECSCLMSQVKAEKGHLVLTGGLAEDEPCRRSPEPLSSEQLFVS